MKKLNVTMGYVLCAAAWPVIFGGCKSEDEYARDVRLSRAAAYRQWETRKTREESQQPRISGKLSLDDCVKLTLVHNKTLQAALEEREVARGQRLSSGSAYLPNLALSAEYRRIDETASFEFTDPITGEEQSFSAGELNNYAAVLTVTQPVYAGGAISAQVRAATLATLIADQTIRTTLQEVVFVAEVAYYDLLLSQHLVEISQDAVRSAKASLEHVEKRRAGGVVSDFDVLRAQVELSNFEADLLRARNAIDISRANLIKIMGISQASDFVLSDAFTYVPLVVQTQEAVEVAFRNRPDLYRQEYVIRQQQEQLRIARSRYLPSVGGFFDQTWARPDPKSFVGPADEWGDTWQAGFRAAWPIFDGFQREGQIIQQKARLRQAEIGLVDTEETVVYNLTQAILTMRNAEEFVASQRLNLTRATEGLRLAEVGYQQGVNTQVELIDAQTALTQARVNYYEAIYRHVVAKITLQRAMGTIVGGVEPGSAGAEPRPPVRPSVDAPAQATPPVETLAGPAAPTEKAPPVNPPAEVKQDEDR